MVSFPWHSAGSRAGYSPNTQIYVCRKLCEQLQRPGKAGLHVLPKATQYTQGWTGYLHPLTDLTAPPD